MLHYMLFDLVALQAVTVAIVHTCLLPVQLTPLSSVTAAVSITSWLVDP